MMRQALLQWLRSPKRTPKPKPFWLDRPHEPKPRPSDDHARVLVRTTMLRSPSRHRRHFCTVPPPHYKELTVTRSEPELVGPAGPTPRGIKRLSSIDESGLLRGLIPVVQIYRHDPFMRGEDPARVIRGALARALVPYYPLAGRLREGPGGRLSVDCTGQGVWFVEAEADAELDELAHDSPRPHFPWLEEFNAPLPGEIVDSPLMYFQVTRLKCGGFVLSIRLNHIMCDAGGLTQFLNAVGEIARGAHSPSVTPVWKRELFIAEHQKLDHPPAIDHDRDVPVNNSLDLVRRSIFLGPSKLSAIRMLVPEHIRSRSTTFEILTAFLWQCRASALELEPQDMTSLGFTVSARDETHRVIPAGYYGNAFGMTWTKTGAGELLERPMEYAIGLVKKAKEKGIKEYESSWRANDAIGCPSDCSPDKWLFVTDARQLGYGDVDFGWGKAAYAGLAKFEVDGVASYSHFRRHDGEDGILVSICMPRETMASFKIQVNNVTVNRS